MGTNIEELNERFDKLETQKNLETLTLVEILSNATFFGELKKANCEYAQNGQCGFFILNVGAKNKIPIASDCCIKHCQESSVHFHIELSNITCALCQIPNCFPRMDFSKIESTKSQDTINIENNSANRINQRK